MFDLVYRFDPDGSHALPPPADAAAALRRLEEGNREFARFLDPAGSDPGAAHVFWIGPDALGAPRPDGSPPVQRPFAAILGCSDARVPTETVFHQAANDLFVVRVAGNILGAECLGSLDYALTNLGDSLKLLAVLGHSGCGAVTAAADAFLDPTRYLEFAATHPLRAIVDRILVAVRAAHRALERAHGPQAAGEPGYRAALIETAVVLNAALTAATLRQEFRERLGPHREIVYGVYDLASRRVKLTLEAEEGLAIRLAPPPADAAAFDRLGMLVAGSGRVRGLLAGGLRS
jgi:carbonic anhydrase